MDESFWFIKEEYEKSLDGYFSRLKLIEQVDSEYVKLSYLKMNGLLVAPQGPIRIKSELYNYIDNFMIVTLSSGFLLGEYETGFFEGEKKKLLLINM